MSIILQWIGRLFTTVPSAHDPETMNLREWADLPAYHPSGDRAPC